MTLEMNKAEEYYDKLSSTYDKATESSKVWKAPSLIAEATHRISIYESVLIIGIGTGKDIDAISPNKNKHFEGIDVSSKMLKICRDKYPHVILHHGDFSVINLSCLRRSHYDLIICSGTLEFIPDFEGFFERVSKLLHREGYLLITYEPQILNHSLQSERVSETVPGHSPYKVEGFKTYRRSTMELLETIKKFDLQIIDFLEFVAYHKVNSDIIYDLVLLKKG